MICPVLFEVIVWCGVGLSTGKKTFTTAKSSSNTWQQLKRSLRDKYSIGGHNEPTLNNVCCAHHMHCMHPHLSCSLQEPPIRMANPPQNLTPAQLK